MMTRYPFPARGFTLAELMITVAIVAVLASIALPSFLEQVRATRRADAEGALLGLSNAMERVFTQNNTYAPGGIPALGGCASCIFAAQSPVDGGTARYTLAITAANATSYTLSATPTTSDPRCGVLTLTSTGVKGEGGTADVDTCWR
jgi:type IV pilus assembly protein PilE